MFSKLSTFSKLTFLVLALLTFNTSCKKDDDSPKPQASNLRPSIDYASLGEKTPYTALFVDANGDSTVNRNEGRALLQAFKVFNDYMGKSKSEEIDSAQISNLFKAIKSQSAASLDAGSQNNVHNLLEKYFGEMARISKFRGDVASDGTSGLLGTRLVDGNGIEWIQVIQKALIGGFQLDYIGNVLLGEGLKADNSTLVSGKNYTALEHNWDAAYGLLTVNDIYMHDATDAKASDGESYLGKYIWEYNKASYKKIHTAFLKGRAAIVNNDVAEIANQANFIRTEMEKAIAGAAVGYMNKTNAGFADPTSGDGAHAFGEGLGFIYSLRFCKMHGADITYSDGIYNALFNKGFWDLVSADLVTAKNAINAKFGL
jgi:hypothetical protein